MFHLFGGVAARPFLLLILRRTGFVPQIAELQNATGLAAYPFRLATVKLFLALLAVFPAFGLALLANDEGVPNSFVLLGREVLLVAVLDLNYLGGSILDYLGLRDPTDCLPSLWGRLR
jgi:hypothetical protein